MLDASDSVVFGYVYGTDTLSRWCGSPSGSLVDDFSKVLDNGNDVGVPEVELRSPEFLSPLDPEFSESFISANLLRCFSKLPCMENGIWRPRCGADAGVLGSDIDATDAG